MYVRMPNLQVLPVNHHVKKRMSGLHDGTVVMDPDQKPVPPGSNKALSHCTQPASTYFLPGLRKQSSHLGLPFPAVKLFSKL